MFSDADLEEQVLVGAMSSCGQEGFNSASLFLDLFSLKQRVFWRKCFKKRFKSLIKMVSY